MALFYIYMHAAESISRALPEFQAETCSAIYTPPWPFAFLHVPIDNPLDISPLGGLIYWTGHHWHLPVDSPIGGLIY